MDRIGIRECYLSGRKSRKLLHFDAMEVKGAEGVEDEVSEGTKDEAGSEAEEASEKASAGNGGKAAKPAKKGCTNAQAQTRE